MKLFSAFALLAVTAAQDGAQAQGDGAATQGAATQGDATQGAQDSGYGAEEQPEAYGAEQSYGEAAPAYEAAPAHYEAAHYEAAPVYKPKICVGACPDDAPYFNLDTGACAPGICDTSSYAGGGYRRLEESDNAYGYEAPAEQAPAAQDSGYGAEEQQPETYAAPAQTYAAPAQTYEAPSCELVAPHGNFVDTRFNRVSRGGRIALWIGFALLFLPAVFFINRYLAIHYLVVDAGLDTRVGSFIGKRINKFIAEPALFCGIVCFIASVAYLCMATGHGFYVRCCDGREFYYARYLDWIFTTPLMLHGIVYLGGFDNDTWTYLFFQDILMIAAGLIGSTTCTSDKWIFFAFSMLNFIPILYYICAEMKKELDTQIYDQTGGIAAKIAKDAIGATVPHIWFWLTFKSAANLLVIVWSLYPLVWILAEGTGVISSNGEAIFYTVLDVIAKSAFGYLIAFAKKNTLVTLKKSKAKLNKADDKYLKAVDDMVKETGAIVKAASSTL